MATTSNELFMAILTMDSYNRGYRPKVSMEGNLIGNAALISDSESLGFTLGIRNDQLISFYAIAYSYDGGTVISYCGTDAAMDVATGWLQGAGYPTPQAVQ